jgi:hypothetical protein
LAEPHEKEQLSQARRGIPNAHLAAQPPTGELQPRQRIDRAEVGISQPAKVAEHELSPAPIQRDTHVFAQRGHVCRGHRSFNDQPDRDRLARLVGTGQDWTSLRARDGDPAGRRKSSVGSLNR